MPTSCAPPDSLIQWAASLMVGAALLLIAALALAPLGPRRWRSRSFGALSLLGALASVGLAAWSLTLSARMEVFSATLTARNQADPYYCVFGGGHAPPGYYPAWQRATAALIDLLQHQALITLCATVAFLLVVLALALSASLRRARRRQLALVSRLVGHNDHASDAVETLATSAPLLWLAWSRRRRFIAGALVALALATGLAAFAEARFLQASALPPSCATGMSAADDQQIHSIGITLLPSRNTVPVDARTAIATSEQNLGDARPAHITCVVTRLAFVNSSTVTEVPRFALVWVVGSRIPGGTPGPDALAAAPGVEWTFVDAQSGKYLYGAWMSRVGG